MKDDKLPHTDHVVRYVPWARLRKDENDNVIGILSQSFKLRSNEDALSTTWLEYFPGGEREQICAVAQAIRASNLKPGGKSGFAVGNVGAIISVSAERKHKIRIVHEPEDDNKAHSAVRRLPREDLELLELFATEVWSKLISNTDIPRGEKPAPDNSAPRTK